MLGEVQYSGFLVYNIDKCWEGTVEYSGFLVYNIDKCGEWYSKVVFCLQQTNVGRGTVQWILGLQHRQMLGGYSTVQWILGLQHRQMWGGVQYSGFLVYNIDKCGEGTVQWILGLQHRQMWGGYSTVQWILGLQHRQMWGGVQYSGFLVYNIDRCRKWYSTVDS